MSWDQNQYDEVSIGMVIRQGFSDFFSEITTKG
jgi:hypothetical protein